MKKWYYILLLLLICGVFIVFGESSEFPIAIKSEIEEAWLKEKGRTIDLDWYQYYGTYDGAVVYLDEGQTQAIVEKTIAGHKFAWPNAFTIHVYKAGEFRTLEEAYEAGILTEKQVGQIAKCHDEYLSVQTNWGDWRPWKEE